MTFLLTLLGFTFIIFIHELGHFLVARWAKVRVEVFSIGIGPRITTLYRDKKGTEYILSLLPFGGYVRMHGQEDMPNKKEMSKDDDSFQSKSPSKRLAIMLGGVTMNVISAYFFIVICYAIGVPFITNQVGMVTPGLPAAEAGVKSKDFIVAINNSPTETFEDVFTKTALSKEGDPFKLEILRNGERQTLDIVWSKESEEDGGIRRLGITPYPHASVGEIPPNSPYYEKGFRKGMRILDITPSNPATEAPSPPSLENAKSGRVIIKTIEKNPNAQVDVSVFHDGKTQVIKSVPLASKKVLNKGYQISSRVNVLEDYPAFSAGLKSGDLITAIDGKKIRGFEDIVSTLDNLKSVRPLAVSFLRDGQENKLFVTPVREEVNNSYFLGISPFLQENQEGSNPMVEVGWISEEMKNQVPGLRVGDLIINLKEENGNVLAKVKRQESEISFSYTTTNFSTREVGVLFPITFSEKIIQLPIFEAFLKSFGLAYKELQEVYLFLYQMINGSISPSNAGGPIAIFETSSTVFNSRGFAYFLLLFAKISISLAVTNLLPIPMLDGGHVVFIIYEMIAKKPAPEGFVYAMHLLGFALLLFLFIFININDIQRILSRQ